MSSYLEIILRCVSVYLFMVVAIRVSGKKELSQLNTTDVVLILLISNAVQNAMVGANSSLQGGLIAATVLFMLNFLLKKIMFKNKNVRKWLNQQPEILIHDGHVEIDKLNKLDISKEELQEALREHGVDNYAEVKLCMLEVDGNISVITGKGNLKETFYKRKRKHKTLGQIN